PAGDLLYAAEPALFIKHAHAAANDAALAGHHQRYGRPLVCDGGIAQQHARLLALVVEDDIERAVVVQIHQANRLRVEDTLPEADAVCNVLEGAVAAVAEQTVRAAQTADEQI